MRLSRPLLSLPIRFDADRLSAEVNALPASAWMPHPTGFAGNDAVPLVTPGGERNDRIDGPMDPTEQLRNCPYIMDIMAALGCVWGRSRLMGLAAGAEVPIHVDIHYYWHTHHRLHIPIITNPDVLFTCDGETVHMQAGECWLFDSFALHGVRNNGHARRIHLVLDTVGGVTLWDLIEAAESEAAATPSIWSGEIANRSFDRLAFEKINRPKVMTPWEMRQIVEYVFDHVPLESSSGLIAKRLERFISGWHALWSRYGTADEGLPAYQSLINNVRGDLKRLNSNHITLRNKMGLGDIIEGLVLRNAVAAI